MKGEDVLLDTMILIDHFNGLTRATSYLAEIAGRARVSAMTRAEVLAGFEPSEAASATQLLDLLPWIPIDAPVADLAAELRRTVRWRLPDAIQAATAIHHRLRLATRNVKAFPPERFEFVVVPYEL